MSTDRGMPVYQLVFVDRHPLNIEVDSYGDSMKVSKTC